MPFNRRRFLLGSLALPALAEKKPAGERCNLALILVDDLPAWMLGCYGNKEVRTPNIDRLANTGVRFTRHFTAAPATGPGRATLLTGRTPMQLGGAESIPASEIPLARILGELGYGFQETGGGAAEEVAAAAGKFIDAQAAGKPFFLTATFTDLRPPYDDVPLKHSALYGQTRFETFVPPDPPAANAKAGKEMLGDIIGGLRKAAATITAVDEQVGAIITRLQQRQLLDNTLVVFTSTCGSLFGRHGLWNSGRASDPVNMYEEVANTPMIWRWPLRLPPQTARPESVSGHDFLPSICELTGAPVPSRNLCGRSYLTVAMGKPLPKKEPWRNLVFGRLENTGMARDSRYKLVLHEDGKGPNELYDLQTDPRERENRYEAGEYASIRPALEGELAKWKQRYSA
jgi:arylsulfatase A-like enzyme